MTNHPNRTQWTYNRLALAFLGGEHVVIPDQVATHAEEFQRLRRHFKARRISRRSPDGSLETLHVWLAFFSDTSFTVQRV